MTSHTQRFLVVVVKMHPGSLNRGKIQINPQKHMQCNAMATELVDRITSIMSIIERTSSDISDKPAFTPPGHIKRQHCKSKEALFCNIFDFFFYRFALGALQNFLADDFLSSCTLDFQAGNFTCILRMKSFEDISC